MVTSISFNVVVWRPDVWRLRFEGSRSILQFGAQMIGISGVTQLGARAGEVFLGSMLGLGPLGLYSRASSLPTTLHGTIYAAGSNVVFSRLSREFNETGAFYLTYVRFMRLLIGLLWPMLFGLAVVAGPVIHVLYGPKWQGAAVPLSLLSVATAITVGIGMTVEVFILRHQTGRQVKIEGMRGIVGFLMFACGAIVGLSAAALAKVAEALVAAMLYRRPMNDLLGGPSGELRQVYIEGLLLSAAASLPVFIGMCWARWSETAPLGILIPSVVLGGFLWLALLFRLRHPIAAELLRLIEERGRKA
jgi:O-antigen/teichoic acid export membrane protein